MDTECPFCGVNFETEDRLDGHFVEGCPMDDETSFSDQSSSLEVCCVSGDEEEVGVSAIRFSFYPTLPRIIVYVDAPRIHVAPFDFHFTPRYPA